MVAWEIEERMNPTSLIPVAVGIIPIPENHADAGIAPILESHVNAGTVHDQEDMPTVVWIPWRNGSPTMLLWML